jgi:hypothetical protein
MTEENLSPEQSLRLIQTMIDKTKQDISGKTHYFLVWGWITFIACTGQFILKHIMNYEKHYLVWTIILVGIVYSAWQGYKEGKSSKVRTYVSDSMTYLWTGMGITYLVLSIVLSNIGWNTSVFPFFIILYALGTFISGNFIKFRPLIVGGILAWILAVVAVYLPYDYQMLVAAAAILVSYIIPAYLLRARNKASLT